MKFSIKPFGVKRSIILFFCIFMFVALVYTIWISSGKTTDSAQKLSNQEQLKSPGAILETDLSAFIKPGQSKSIIIRLINNDCQECTDSIFNNVLKLADKIGKERIYILIGGRLYDNDYHMYKRLHKFDLDNIYLMRDRISSVDSLGLNYYFIASTEMPNSTESVHLVSTIADADYKPIYNEWVK